MAFDGQAIRTGATQIAHGIWKGVLTRPSNIAKQSSHGLGMRYANQPITAIRRRTEDRILTRELSKGVAYVARRHTRNIGADEYYWPWWQGPQRRIHALAQITTPLAATGQMLRPTRISVVNEQPAFPTIAATQSADRSCQVGAIKPKRLNGPNIRCQTPFRSA
jgi:hypothetical protein